MIDICDIWRYDLVHLTSIWRIGNPIYALMDSFQMKMTDVGLGLGLRLGLG